MGVYEREGGKDRPHVTPDFRHYKKIETGRKRQRKFSFVTIFSFEGSLRERERERERKRERERESHIYGIKCVSNLYRTYCTYMYWGDRAQNAPSQRTRSHAHEMQKIFG
jgi:hypothetical protein